MSRDHSCEACGRGGMNDCQDAELTRLRATVADLTEALGDVLAWRDSSETGQAARADAFEVLARAKEVKP